MSHATHWQFILTFQTENIHTTEENTPQISSSYFFLLSLPLLHIVHIKHSLWGTREKIYLFLDVRHIQGGNHFFSCRQKLLILFWRRSITPACPLLTSTYTNGRSYGSGCQETSTITDASHPSVALSHNKTRRFLVTALSSSPSADDHFCFSL